MEQDINSVFSFLMQLYALEQVVHVLLEAKNRIKSLYKDSHNDNLPSLDVNLSLFSNADDTEKSFGVNSCLKIKGLKVLKPVQR